MAVKTLELYFEKPVEDLYITNITSDVQKSIHDTHIKSGIANVFIGCSTASISTMKHAPHNLKQMHEVLERIAPTDAEYLHHKTVADLNGIGADVNGKSHVRSAIIGPSITVPFKDSKLLLDKDQDIVLMDFDLIRRKRKVIVQIMGE